MSELQQERLNYSALTSGIVFGQMILTNSGINKPRPPFLKMEFSSFGFDFLTTLFNWIH